MYEDTPSAYMENVMGGGEKVGGVSSPPRHLLLQGWYGITASMPLFFIVINVVVVVLFLLLLLLLLPSFLPCKFLIYMTSVYWKLKL